MGKKIKKTIFRLSKQLREEGRYQGREMNTRTAENNEKKKKKSERKK